MKEITIYLLSGLMLSVGGVGFGLWTQNELSPLSVLGFVLGILLFFPASMWWIEFFTKKLK